MGAGLPYWRLSAFYFFFFASLGALIPYWGLYLRSLGHAPDAIGQLVALLMATKIVAPNIWAWVADRREHRLPVVRLAALLSVVSFAGVFAGHGFWWLAAVMCLFSFFWNATLPQFEAVTLNHLGDDTHGYSRIRLWGSVGFVLAVAALGEVLESRGPALVPWAVVILMAGIWVASTAVPEAPGRPVTAAQEPLSRVLRRPAVLALLVACFLMQASHGTYYVFYTIYLEDHGYSRGLIGQLWALGVVAEVVLFLFMHRLLQRFSLRSLFLGCFALTVVRWLVVAGLVESLTAMVFAQLLHAATFGVYHAVAIALIHRYFVGRYQGRGQALYSSMSFGAGGALGSLASGQLWVTWGPQSTWLVAAATGVAGLLVAWRWVAVRDTEPAPRCQDARS